MRTFTPILALLLAAALAAPVLADPGNGDGNGGGGNGGGNAGGQGSENSGNPNAGSGNNSGNSSGNASANAGNQLTRVPKDENVAREAVKKREVLSLATVTALVGESTKGRVLDVELVRLAGVYLYEVTVLEPDGRLHKLYYNARSGALVDH
ncbi:hypothetical protein LJR016_000012 [Devosia sp. LjRoot16]|jgi:hypothetical protein|uniref:PepSY domain-containing protein n=1 Tax=unclassified Devosia TaxID=196773 RepID=UPI0006F7CA7E|nr:PepSY domain-containing protein [Devosia sp. Root105]KQU92927.1 hypothetical protein ASC68_24160 [Devosia sp. Root105]